MLKNEIKTLSIVMLLLLIGSNVVISSEVKINENIVTEPTVKINIDTYTTIYEGDIIDCSITGDPTFKYWKINDGAPHFLFNNDDPVIFDPEPTPIEDEYVNLTVYAENELGNDTDTVIVKIKRIFFGDIHWHSTLCDGQRPLDLMYQNAVKDNYLDFVCYSGHAEWIDGLRASYRNIIFNKSVNLVTRISKFRDYTRNVLHFIKYGNDWVTIKEKTNEYYNEGEFSTLLGFEWTASDYPNCHVNFYYRDVYPDALEYSSSDVVYDANMKPNLDDIFEVMTEEWDKGHLNIGYPHHPQFRKVNWTYMANNVNKTYRDKILRGAEVYSIWGNAIGQNYTPGIPYNWPYYEYVSKGYMKDAWAENAMWEWSDNSKKGQRFSLIAGSDTHNQNRPGSALPEGNFYSSPYNPSGIIAVYSVHNNRTEIWDSMNVCDNYALQLLKIRANVRFDGQMALGRWINCSSPLNIMITAQSTFPDLDHSGKNMHPHGYSSNKLNYPIEDIWLIKNDRDKGKPWCKVINHSTPNENLVVVNFQDYDVQPNDFYWVAIKQKGDLLKPRIPQILINLIPGLRKNWDCYQGERDEYMAYIGPVFIDNIIN